ncbi:hypothetical protein JAAARDRAFT_28713 [Jaapia argillacea MUCL 33604]|uniref:Cyclin-domain-containing protein n=1 Tax=Jaapia argillacea MUCL 33604 TaxID=933084 RepID=A0A067QFU5_9AGAM|nr:hypothetical protein JAAARDRAFT_28713 [Jaapia argillacea MUCL 33604]
MLALAPALPHTPSDTPHRAPSAASSSSITRPMRPASRRVPSSSSSASSSSTSSSSTTPTTTRPPSVASSHSQSHRQCPPSHLASSNHNAPSQLSGKTGTTIVESGTVGQPHTSAPSTASTNPTPAKTVEHQPETPAFDIHTYPSTELLRLLASLLTQIAATNDALASSSPSHSPSSFSSHSRSASLSNDSSSHPPIWRSLTTASRTALSIPSSSLAFHARNIPTISLEAYLLRILKYCPTTNEVFLSLLVYFDRMSKLSSEATGKTFVIDSYNIHRLVIAGVTVASKFFSDVFYTNSRYAKVGGLPQTELNQLELQFLLLNDFRLMISTEEMQRYAEQLILFSQSNHQTDASPSPVPAPPIERQPSAPLQAMGAVDAYGGRIVDPSPTGPPADRGPRPQPEEASHNHHDDDDENQPVTRTPNARPSMSHRASISSTHTQSSSVDSDAGTETEYDGETDDEPTIRPPGSDTQSLYSVESVEDRDEPMGSP